MTDLRAVQSRRRSIVRLACALVAAAIALILGTGCDRERSAATTAAASCNPSPARNVIGGYTGRTAPEVQGSMPRGQLWATFGMPDYPGVPRGSRWAAKDKAIFVNLRGKPIKIGFLVTGSGHLTLVARSADGTVVKPRWGPQLHSRRYLRGSRLFGAWGAGFVFRKVGCWTIEARRGRTHGRLVFVVRS